MWWKIIVTIYQLDESVIIVNNVINRVDGDESSTLFWQDQSIGDNTLMRQFPCISWKWKNIVLYVRDGKEFSGSGNGVRLD